MANMPVDLGAILNEATNLKGARETPVSVSMYIDDSAADDVIAFARNAFASASPNARLSIAYLTNTDFVINDKDDFACIVAGRDMRVGEKAEQLRDAGLPVMVVTGAPNLVDKLATEQGHPIPKGDVVASERVSIDSSRAAEAIANLPQTASEAQAPEYSAGAEETPASAAGVAEVVVDDVQVVEAAVLGADSPDAQSVAGGADASEPNVAGPAGQPTGSGALASRAARGGLGVLASVIGRASAAMTRARENAVANAAPAEPVNPFLAEVPEGLDDYAPLNEKSTALLSTRMGKWVIEACKAKALSMALAFPFVRRPFADNIVNTTSVQNAGIGAVMFIPGADMPIMTLNQCKMILQIAAAYGQDMTFERAKEIAAIVAGAFACRSAARQVVGIVPVGGWIVKGAIGYSGTLAMGKAAIEYFEGGAGVVGLAGLGSKLNDAVQGVIVSVKGEPEPKSNVEKVSDFAQKAAGVASVAATQAGPVAKAAGKVALASFSAGASSLMGSLGDLGKK